MDPHLPQHRLRSLLIPRLSSLCFNDVFVLFVVLDTAGQEEFSAMREQYMRKGDGFMIVYSVTDPNSFKNVPNFFTQILRVKDRWVYTAGAWNKSPSMNIKSKNNIPFARDEYPILLVANKVDLVHLRKISESEGRAMADRLNLPYMETSAKDPPQNIDGAFHEVYTIALLFCYYYSCHIIHYIGKIFIMGQYHFFKNRWREVANNLKSEILLCAMAQVPAPFQ